jgi:hypothetical protein
VPKYRVETRAEFEFLCLQKKTLFILLFVFQNLERKFVQQRSFNKYFRVGGFFLRANSRGITIDHIEVHRGEISGI